MNVSELKREPMDLSKLLTTSPTKTKQNNNKILQGVDL